MVLASTAQAAALRPCGHYHTFRGVRYYTHCGSASVTLHLRGKTYRIAGGDCEVDANGHFHVDVGSFDADKLVGSNINKTLRLSSFSLEAIGRSGGGKYKIVEIFYVLPGDHPPGEEASPATVTVVGGRYGSFSARYAQPPVSGTFHC